MARIAKKSRSVKRQNAVKSAKNPLRYVIRKDSLDRRYAVDKQTGQRVSLYRAEKERKQRKPVKPAKLIPRHKISKPRRKVAKAPKPSKRSLAAKKGWETRKARTLGRSEAAKKGWATRRKAALPKPVELVPISVLTPPERLFPDIELPPYMLPLHGLFADRMALYPKVKQAAEDAFVRLQTEAWTKRADLLEEKKPVKLTREEQIQSNIRDLIAERITDPVDIEHVVEQLFLQLDQEYSVRELYEIYFSPEVA